MSNLRTRSTSVLKPALKLADTVPDLTVSNSVRRITRQSSKLKEPTVEATTKTTAPATNTATAASKPPKLLIETCPKTTEEKSEINALRTENLELKAQLDKKNKEILQMKAQNAAKSSRLQRFKKIKTSVNEKFQSWQKKLDNHLKEFKVPIAANHELPVQVNETAPVPQVASKRRKRVKNFKNFLFYLDSFSNCNLIFKKLPNQEANSLEEYNDAKSKSKLPTVSSRKKVYTFI